MIDIGSEPQRRPSSGNKIRARQIVDGDLSGVAKLLAHGFERSTPRDWLRIFEQLSKHSAPTDAPQYGYLLESDDKPVGVILVISSTTQTSEGWVTRSNLSSWYVLPPFRGFASLFISRVIKNKDVTYLNVSPAPHTLPTLEAQGFSRYSAGQYFAVANPFARAESTHVRIIAPDDPTGFRLEPFERDLLLEHAQYGCLSLICQTREGAFPFIFRFRRVKKLIPCARLIYCREIAVLVRFLGPISRFLVRKGMPVMIIDSPDPIVGLRGMHVGDISPKYYKGRIEPRVGDLAHTEASIFGI